MSWIQRGMLVGVAALAGLIVMSRNAGSKEAGLDPDQSPMKNSVYAAPVPVYYSAEFQETTGGNYYDDIGGPVTFTSKSWFFRIKDPVEEVAAFYAKNLPAGAHPEEAMDGDMAFEWTPPGAAAGERVSVTIGDGELQISEVVKAKP